MKWSSILCVALLYSGSLAAAGSEARPAPPGRSVPPGRPVPPALVPPGERVAPADSIDTRLLRSYLPKEELGITRFLSRHPDADGRGVVVAILDTGVDLRQPGLLRTPLGERKIADVYDATDNGLCDLPYTVTTSDSVLTGLTGRPLRLGARRADDGVYRLGRLSAWEVFPRAMNDRVRQERKTERERMTSAWETEVSEAEAAAPAEEDSTFPLDRDKAYRKIRREADRDYKDPGPLYDMVACRRGGRWVLWIDTGSDGTLATELAPYHVDGDVALFPPPLSLSAALAWIAEDGSQVSLFFDEGGHGTHVAGIVGAYYGPDDPLNGLAPGARILAIKVGNGRLGGTTSHNSIIKGIDWAVRHGAMVANLSFGGSSFFDDGREITSEYLDEVVQNHGIFIAVSAGNEGPGLSTVGSPGTARRVFTMGAAISPSQMLTGYGGFEGAPGMNVNAPPRRLSLFSFSSRGPLFNGSRGVDFVSPGAAVSTLPTWLLTRNENWNGTSMAAPQAAGCLALLLSAARQDSIPVSPARVDRALRATAVPLEGVTYPEQGAGLLQVPEAYEALRALARAFPATPPRGHGASASADPAADPKDTNPSGTSFQAADSVQVPGIGVPATRDPVTLWGASFVNATGTGEGYYERDQETSEPYYREFRIQPDLPPLGANPLRDRFNRVVRLVSTVPWMEAPPQLSIPASGAFVRVKLDPGRMQPGLNTGLIRLIDVADAGPHGATRPLRDVPGTEVEVPATVIRPEVTAPPDYRLERVLELAPGERSAVFVKVPEGATRMHLRIREDLAEPANTYYLAGTAISLLHSPLTLRDVTGFSLRRGQERTLYQRVEAGTVSELAFFARWVNTGPGRLRVTIDFDGLTGPEGLGSPATFEGEESNEARWGERPVSVPAGEKGAVLPLRAILKGVDADIAAAVTGRAEPLEIQWDQRPDSLYTAPLEQKTAVMMLGRAWLRLDRGESVTVDLHEGPEFEDFLDDSFYRLFDPSGALASYGTLSSGPFTVKAEDDGPDTGWYRMEISIFALGRAFVKDWSLFSPELIRGASCGQLTLFPDALAAQTVSADSLTGIDVPRGASRRFVLRATGLPENSTLTGHAVFREDETKPGLLRIPLRVDTRPPVLDAETSLDQTVTKLTRSGKRLRALPPRRYPDELAGALADLDKAEGIERAFKGDDYESSGEAWDALWLRADLWLRQGSPKDATREVDHLLDEAQQRLDAERSKREKASRKSPGSPADLADKLETAHDREGALLLRRAELALLSGDVPGARKALDQAAASDFGGEDADPVTAELLAREGHYLEALEPARQALEDDRFNPEAARRVIECYIHMGWLDLAGEALNGWLDRYPRERPAFFELLKAWTSASWSPEARRETPFSGT